MKHGIDHGLLLNDLDANHFRILNLVSLDSDNLIKIDDSRLSDKRIIINGTVTNDSIADSAAIDQLKVNFNGNIPAPWFGTDDTHAARGDLAEFKSNRDVPNGYASLDLNLKMPTGSTPTSGTGTLSSINFELPFGELTVVPEESGTTRSFPSFWAAQDGDTFFGNFSGASAPPSFETGRVFPVDMIPGFDASRIISGTFNVDQLPIAQGIGVGHAAGLVPTPGTPEINTTAQPSDYLARDMSYKPMKIMVSYQPQIPPPSITVQSYFQGNANVTITSSFPDANLFYSINDGAFTEIISHGDAPTLPVLVPVGAVVNAYAAQAGYNNSEIVMYTIPPSPTPTL